MDKSIEEVEKILGYTFKDKNILMTGLTHSSYANDYLGSSTRGNERLEFLGDAILDMVIGADLYYRFPEKQEGFMSKLRAEIVCEEALGKVAEETHLNEYMLLGKGEEVKGGRKRYSITSDLVEALIAAVYVDGGILPAIDTVNKLMASTIERASKDRFPADYKTRLQEYFQKNGKIMPEYRIVGEEGPDHDKTFTAAVFLSGKELARGAGRSKKEAELRAAQEALKNIE